MTVKSYHHAYRLFRHRFCRVSCRVHHHYATTLALVHVNMVETRKRYRKHLKIRAGVKEILAQRHVALKNHICSCSAFNVLLRPAVRIYHNLMPLLLQIVTSLLYGFHSESQWLQKDYLHRLSFLLFQTTKIVFFSIP